MLLTFSVSSNKRTDAYGGSPEARSKFALDIVAAISERIGEERTAIRLSPWSPFQDMRMEYPLPTFSYFVAQLRDRHPKLAFLHVVEGRDVVDGETSNDELRKVWRAGRAHKPEGSDGRGVWLSAEGHDRPSAFKFAKENGDVVVFGKYFISNVGLRFLKAL